MVCMVLCQMPEFLSLKEARLKIFWRDKVLSNFDAIVNITDLENLIGFKDILELTFLT